MTAGGLELAIRQRARLLIDTIVEEELEQALGVTPSCAAGTRAPAIAMGRASGR